MTVLLIFLNRVKLILGKVSRLSKSSLGISSSGSLSFSLESKSFGFRRYAINTSFPLNDDSRLTERKSSFFDQSDSKSLGDTDDDLSPSTSSHIADKCWKKCTHFFGSSMSRLVALVDILMFERLQSLIRRCCTDDFGCKMGLSFEWSVRGGREEFFSGEFMRRRGEMGVNGSSKLWPGQLV